MRGLFSPSAGSTIVDTVQPGQGGLGTTTAQSAKVALNAIPIEDIDMPDGVVGLDSEGRISASLIPELGVTQIAVKGPTSVFVGQTVQYKITNYDMFTLYALEVISGSVSRIRDTIYYTAPTNAQPGGFTLNGRSIRPTIKPPGPVTPSITSPVNNSAAVSTSYSFTSSVFEQIGDAATHQSTDWQIATDADFTNVVKTTINDTVNKTNWPVTGLDSSTSYFARVRYLSTNGNYSDWSDVSAFTTASAFVVNQVLSSGVNNYNMKTAAIAAGWDQLLPLQMTVTVNNGVVIGSTTTSAPAFDSGLGFPVGTTLYLVNNGIITGKGGNGGGGAIHNYGNGNDPRGYPGEAGGTALRAQHPLSATNNGTIQGGGGGGGGGNRSITFDGQTFDSGGGGGGGGAGHTVGTGTIVQGNAEYWSAKGADGTLTAGGLGSNILYYSGYGGSPGPNGQGGNGGAPGQPGTAGEAGTTTTQPGGAAGIAVQGNGNVTWNSIGIRLGPINN